MKQNNLDQSFERKDFPSLAMLRFAEIAIKSSKTRRWLTNRLIKHIKFLLHKFLEEDFEVINEYSRIFIKTDKLDEALNILTRTAPGIVSGSKVYQTSSQFVDITKLVEKNFLPNIQKNSSFAIKVKRTGKHNYSSIELAGQLGEFVLNNVKEKNVKVDLSNPDYLISVEVRREKAYLFDETIKGVGGLPVGCQGKVLVIVEGEEAELANIFDLYKRGALTYIVSIKENLTQEFREAVKKILELQMQLKNKEIKYIQIIEIEKILNYYKQRKCLSIALSRKLFEEIQENLPTKIPLFVPDLVATANLEEVKNILD